MTLMFWGILLGVFHFEFGGFEIIPNLLGYILVCVGLFKCKEESENFRKAIPLGIITTVLAGVIFGGILPFQSREFGMVNLIFAALWLCEIYFIVQGIKDIESNMGADLKTQRLSIVWKVLAIFQIIAFAMPVVYSDFMQKDSLAAIALVVVLGMGILNMLFLFFFHKTKKIYEDVKKKD